MNPGWIYLLLGTVGEVTWILTLKSTEGFSKLFPTLLNLTIAFLNIWILSKAFNVLPTAAAYSIWVGLSTIAVTGIAWAMQGEEMSPTKLFRVMLIVVGVIGLKWSGTQL